MTADQEMDYQRRFGGIARLYGEQALDRFAASHVCVIGIGGVGSWAVEALARSGIGEITMIDMDHLAESNINRQLPALSSELGRAKIEAMADRIRGINPRCRINPIDEFVDDQNLGKLVRPDFDYVIDCIDGFKIKSALIAYCKRNRIQIITMGGAGGRIDPLLIRQADLSRTEHDALLAKTRKQLRKFYNFTTNLKRRFDIPAIYSQEQPVRSIDDGEVCNASGLNCGGYGSVTSVTATFGMMGVAHVLKRLANR